MGLTARIALHALGWAALIALRSADSVARATGIAAEAASPADWRALLQWSVLIAAVYLNHLFLVPRLFADGRRAAFWATSIAVLIATLTVPRIAVPPTPPKRAAAFRRMRPPAPSVDVPRGAVHDARGVAARVIAHLVGEAAEVFDP